MSEKIEASAIVTIFQNLEKKLSDKTWTDTQDVEFINSLKQIKNIVENLMVQVSIFIDYFEQYVQAIQQASIFNNGAVSSEPENGNVSNNPTQTFSEPTPPQGIDNA